MCVFRGPWNILASHTGYVSASFPAFPLERMLELCHDNITKYSIMEKEEIGLIKHHLGLYLIIKKIDLPGARIKLF